jgi:putative AlgH/UPF0301 family transcriptional regulator
MMAAAASTPPPGAAEPTESASWPDESASADEKQEHRLRGWRDCRARLVAAESRRGPLFTPDLGHRGQGMRDARATRSIEDAHKDRPDKLHASSSSLSSSSVPPFSPWAHPLAQIEVGACLLASTSHVWPKATEYLRHAVILVTDVDARAGVQGLLLNRPTGQIVGRSPGVLARVGAEFAGNPVMLGGDCCMGHLEVLHAHREIAGAREVMPGMYRGGVNACRSMVAQRLASPAEFRILISYARWTWEQLTDEMALNAWDIAAVSPDLLFLPSPSEPVSRAAQSARLDPKYHWDRIRRQLRLSS